MSSPEIDLLVRMLDEAYDRRSWHGANLRGAIRGLDVPAASWRPAPRRHNIWEIAVHAAYWKYAVWRRIRGAKRGSFPLDGSDWFERPAGSDARRAQQAQWRRDRALLADMHAQLRETVAALTPDVLSRALPGSALPARALITGIAAHDLYHAGQIQLLKRLRATA
jgi:hypothetical protein